MVSILTRPSSKLTKLWARSLQGISLSWLQWGSDSGTSSSSSPKGSWKVPNKKILTSLYYTLYIIVNVSSEYLHNENYYNKYINTERLFSISTLIPVQFIQLTSLGIRLILTSCDRSKTASLCIVLRGAKGLSGCSHSNNLFCTFLMSTTATSAMILTRLVSHASYSSFDSCCKSLEFYLFTTVWKSSEFFKK